MNKLIIGIAFASAMMSVLGLENAAQAITFTLDNGFSRPEVQDSFIYNVNGLSLTATGLLANGTSRNVYRSRQGLGVTDQIFGDGDRNQIDGVGLAETLVLSFSQQINLNSVTFTRVGTNDSFKLLVDGNQFIAADIPGGNNADFDIGIFNFDPSPTGTVFGLTVNDRNDDYFVKELEVSLVPEPLTMLGVGTAIGFGSFFKRKLADGAKKV